MKRITTFILFLALLLASLDAFPETAIFPYRVNNPSVFFNEDTGKEYARLLSVAAIYKKGMQVLSPRDTETDMKRLGLSSEKTLTGDDLYMFGKTRYLDYILAGSISKAGKSYISKSILYSVREKKILSRFSSRSSSLFRLAEKETGEAFIHLPDMSRGMGKRSLDLAFIIDLSYNVNRDWASIKQAMTDISSKLIDEYGVNTRIYINSYTGKESYDKTSVSVNSIISLKKHLNSLSPAGGPGTGTFEKTLGYAVKNIKWRKGAEKHIVIILNSDPGHSGFTEGHALSASRNKIRIHSLTLGSIKGDENETVRRLSEISGGIHSSISYYMSVFKPDGERVHLYFENGRFFQSPGYHDSWEDGIRSTGNDSLTDSGSPLDEIMYDEKKVDVSPYNMDEKYTSITGTRTIKKMSMRNNIYNLLEKVILKGTGSLPWLDGAARVLLTDGKLSLWVPVNSKEMMDFFRKRHEDKTTFPLGVSIRSDMNEAYGLVLIPEITDISYDYIPEMLKVRLEDVIKKRKAYSGKGFFYPPIWFLELKAAEIKGMKKTMDIRDQ